MADAFDAFLPALLAREGGGTFTNRSSDRGGPTRWGMTAATLGAERGLGRPATAAEVQALGQAEAQAIYRRAFFQRPGFDLIAPLAPRVAEELIDSGVNMGTRAPSLWLQRALNLCNQRGRHWPDLKLDGDLGDTTRKALQAMIQRRGIKPAEDVLLKCLNGFQFGRYVEITEAGGPNSDQEDNFVGWCAQRVGLAG